MKPAPFTTITSVAAPLPEAQVDTDVIFPARFLLQLQKEGLGRHLFHERRADGDFVLDLEPWNKAQILVTGPDFGTGSSREQAVWALADFGIRCVIGCSFGEIFFANCFRNGILPIIVSESEYQQLLHAAQDGQRMKVDLPAERIRFTDASEITFAVEPHRKRALMEGLDEIGVMLADDEADITAFEKAHRAARPWLFLSEPQLAHFGDLRDLDDA